MTIAVMLMTGKKEFFKSSPSRIKVTTHEIAEYPKFIQNATENATSALFSENLRLSNDVIRMEEAASIRGKQLIEKMSLQM